MLAAAQHSPQLTAFVLAEIDQVSYVHRCLRIRGGQDESIIQAMSSSESRFTDKQGQYLAFIDAYTRVNGRPPAEADMQRHFRVSPPSVHQMVLTDRKSVVSGKSVSVRVDLGGRGIFNKNSRKQKTLN